jgi:hypothetical protein
MLCHSTNCMDCYKIYKTGLLFVYFTILETYAFISPATDSHPCSSSPMTLVILRPSFSILHFLILLSPKVCFLLPLVSPSRNAHRISALSGGRRGDRKIPSVTKNGHREIIKGWFRSRRRWLIMDNRWWSEAEPAVKRWCASHRLSVHKNIR